MASQEPMESPTVFVVRPMEMKPLLTPPRVELA
jgi:hypothetical protein